MTFYSKQQITVVFKGPVTIENYNNHSYIKYSGKEDYKKLCFLARHAYKIKTRKTRIVNKYIRKLINDALRLYLKENHVA